MSVYTNMLNRTSSIFSLRTFVFLETCFYLTAGKKHERKTCCSRLQHLLSHWSSVSSSCRFSGVSSESTLKKEVNSNIFFSIAAKSRKRSLNSLIRSIKASVYFFCFLACTTNNDISQSWICVVQGL